MTTIAHIPAVYPTPPAAAAPQRGCDVLAELRARPAGSAVPAVLATLAWAAATVGIAPAVLWPLRFRQAVDADRQTLRRLADWATGRVSPPEARELNDLAARIRFAAWPYTLGLAGALVSAVAVAWGLTHTGGTLSPFDRLMGLTFGFFWPKFHHVTAGRGAWAVAYAAWSAGLAVAYLSHLVQVHLHARNVRRFLDGFNRVLVDQGAPPAYLKPIGWGFSPLWALTAVACLMFGGIWGIPLAAAGATDRRYRRKANPKLRAGLCERVRTALLHEPTYSSRQPAIAARPAAATPCVTSGCGGTLRPGAKFCARCGQRR